MYNKFIYIKKEQKHGSIKSATATYVGMVVE